MIEVNIKFDNFEAHGFYQDDTKLGKIRDAIISQMNNGHVVVLGEDNGMTFMGAMECIFADEKPTDYDLGATKDWLPKSKEFDDWIGYSPSMAQVVIAVYLIYGGN
ncbi:gp24 [Streptococcus pneumoniae]|nr:gp24 [Streptococcus pneumoniae]